MRVSKEAKAETNNKIIAKAAQLFRQKGIEATSVNDIMAAAGLTHGGFYRHFSSKTDLAIAAIQNAFEGRQVQLESLMETHGANLGLTKFVEMYLSNQHVDNPGMGCPIAALASEVGQHGKAFGSVIDMGTQRLAAVMAMGFSDTQPQAQDKAIALLSALIGSVIQARAVQSEHLKQNILAAGSQLAKKYIDIS